jgi:hypothetical protein
MGLCKPGSTGTRLRCASAARPWSIPSDDKAWMGATHFQMKTLKHAGTEMALHVLAYNMKRLMRMLGVGGLIEAIRA